MLESRRIGELFTSSFLRSGANFVKNCGFANVAGVEVQLFLAATDYLEGEIYELIVLDQDDAAQNNAPSVDELVALLARTNMANKASHVWYISSSITEPKYYKANSPHITFMSPARFCDTILQLPDTMFSLWMKEAANVDVSDFSTLYQKRAASTLILSPEQPEGRYPDIDVELARWALSEKPERPILLIGDRGSGKTWQVLRFCQEQQARHKKEPWHAAPVAYLSLRGIAGQLVDAHIRTMGLYALLSQRYAPFAIKWGMPMLQAFLETGHFIVCLDGLDEFGIDMPSEGIADHLSRIAELLPRGSKFLVTCRTTHFASFAEMANLATWRESTLAGTMRVLQLSPFGPTELNNYIHVAVESISEPPASRRLRDLINPGDMSTPTALALERCVEEPAILSRLVNELMEVPQLTELELLRSALEGSLIGFNLDAERSSPFHLDSEGEIVEFGVRQRVALLGELAWYMAERDLDAIELTSLPRRIALMFGINCQALQRDLRSQTVFELDRSSNDCGSLYQVDEGIESHVRFGLRMKHVENSQRSTSHDHTLSESSSCSVDSSVAGAYFLANHIVSRLCDHLILPGVRFTDVLRYIGQIELDWVATAILRLMINAGEIDGINAEHLAMSIRAHIMNLAAQGNFAVFDRTIRYLVPNALRMGILTSADAEEIDPWTPDIKAVTSSPPALPRYEMVFIPPVIASHKSLSQPPGTHIDDEPFLLGLHEITNQDYERFIRSERGQEWSPERTRNVSPKGSSTSSEAAQKTNEYNLYFWEPELVDGENVFAPTTNTRNHPVVYVSLYAAKAFCDWLSDDLARSDAKSHYRLPTSAEWVWAAQGPYSNAKYPWDLLPYPIPALEQSDALQTPTSISSSNHHDAINWFNRYRQSTTKVLLDTGRRSNEVGLNDEFTPFAVMGLVGNVKEWVGDLRTDTNDSSKPRKGMVFGGTAHLGEDSFLFGYNAQLYPENTNPDVGFRVARSLSHHELSSLRQREACLAELTLPNRVKG